MLTAPVLIVLTVGLGVLRSTTLVTDVEEAPNCIQSIGKQRVAGWSLKPEGLW